MAKIIDGKAIAEQLENELRDRVVKLRDRGIIPGLSVILVGDDPASQIYVRNKERACERLGIHSEVYRLPGTTAEGDLLALIGQLKNDSRVHGILVQVPLPHHIDEERVILEIDPDKDVDGFHPVNVGRMVIGNPKFLPCTPHGCKILLERSGIEISGKHVVILGRSNLVGKPLANIMMQKAKGANAIVTVCHTGAKDLAYYTRQADILVVAVGVPKLVTGDMVKEGVVVLDVGTNRLEAPETKKGKLVGDVDFDSVAPKASAISPVPGGVGPMTVTMLMYNTVQSAEMAS